mmetsp:Transcript_32546/g.52122  ORF Transcript_32546/g.52122 Transcript_32546/m.52122 type:complete len:232 (-) Transcript_32546:412-1107(-)
MQTFDARGCNRSFAHGAHARYARCQSAVDVHRRIREDTQPVGYNPQSKYSTPIWRNHLTPYAARSSASAAASHPPPSASAVSSSPSAVLIFPGNNREANENRPAPVSARIKATTADPTSALDAAPPSPHDEASAPTPRSSLPLSLPLSLPSALLQATPPTYPRYPSTSARIISPSAVPVISTLKIAAAFAGVIRPRYCHRSLAVLQERLQVLSKAAAPSGDTRCAPLSPRS